jgi:hypothetical protein
MSPPGDGIGLAQGRSFNGIGGWRTARPEAVEYLLRWGLALPWTNTIGRKLSTAKNDSSGFSTPGLLSPWKTAIVVRCEFGWGR